MPRRRETTVFIECPLIPLWRTLPASRLQKRLIFLRELLHDSGNIVVHLDNRKLHYIKVILDEHNFANEVIWHKGREGGSSRSHGIGSAIPTEYQNLLIYAKNRSTRYWQQILGPYKRSTVSRIEHDEKGWYYARGRMGRKPAEWELEAGVALKTYVSNDLSKTKEVQYHFHFLTPLDYDKFFQFLRGHSYSFVSRLDASLANNGS